MVASGSMMVRFSPLKMGLFGSILYYIIYKKYDNIYYLHYKIVLKSILV